MMKSDIQIRTIEQKDDAALASIIRQTLAEFGANHAGTVYYDENTDRLSTIFTVPGSVYFVAEEDGKILGGGGIYPTEGLDEHTCELVKMYLLPGARGKGLGRALLQKCMDYARLHGYKNMYLESMPELKLAIGLYKKAGFKTLSATMGRSGHFGCGIWMMLRLE